MGGGWCFQVVNGPTGVGVWKHIIQGWEIFARNIEFLLGDGSRVKFWSDRWCGNIALMNLFPSVFQLAREKEVLVAESLKQLEIKLHGISTLLEQFKIRRFVLLGIFFTFSYSL